MKKILTVLLVSLTVLITGCAADFQKMIKTQIITTLFVEEWTITIKL